MRPALLTLIACLLTLSPPEARGQMKEAPGNVKLNGICEHRGRNGCAVHFSIEGMITIDAAHSFASLLELEQKRAGAPLQPVVTIQSTGGDLGAAMFIGREIRKRLGSVVSTGPCHSACVFAAMGGVDRNLAGIGLHRPYFSSSEGTSSFADTDARFKKMVRLVREYLFEMNISEDIFRLMMAVPPGEMRLLPPVDARRVGLNGLDPAYDEFRTAQDALQYGVTSAELRRRHASLDAHCGREEDMRSVADLRRRDDCRARIRDRVLWGFDEEKFALLSRSSADQCKGLRPESPEARACLRTIAEAIRRNARAH